MAQWKITKDNISTPDEGSDVGVRGPRSWTDDEGVQHGFQNDVEMPHKFRLRDDDGIIYYYGFCSEDGDFSPLDDFGMPNAGATEIQYKSPTGDYETL